MDSEDSARDFLERMLIDEHVEPTDLPVSLLKSITCDFSNDLLIGNGGFAVVYQGLLQNGTVAVKKMNQTLHVPENKFRQEVDTLMSVKHENIVRFLGFCSDTQWKKWKLNEENVIAEEHQRFLCFEYLPSSLDKYIKDPTGGQDWRTCYKIIKGICKGLHYLHQQNIVHLDLKPANILLDDDMIPKIADFGISRRFSDNQSQAMTSNLIGTVGYMAPEFCDGVISFKSDIYSLGIMIIEILTGNKGCPDFDDVYQSCCIKFKMRPGDAREELIRASIEIGIWCTNFNPTKRPDTGSILENLGYIEDYIESLYGVLRAELSTSSERNASRSVSETMDEAYSLFVSEAPSPLQRITSKGALGLEVTSTMILDVHPLELRFLRAAAVELEPIIRSVTLTNWTQYNVGVWVTPICPDKWADICHPDSKTAVLPRYVRMKILYDDTDDSSSLFKLIEPRSTIAIPMANYFLRTIYPPPGGDGTGTFEVLTVTMGSKTDFFETLKQSIGSRLNMHVNLLKRVEALGGEVHRAMLKTSVVECDDAESSDEAARCKTMDIHTFISETTWELIKDYSIENIDVHRTEPWVLVNALKFSKNNKVLLLNYTTKEILTPSLHFESRKIYMAKFTGQEQQWLATGDSDGYVTVYATNTKDEVIKKFSAHGGNPVWVLAVHPTYPFFLTSALNDTRILLWDWDQGWKCTRVFDQCEVPYSIRWNPLDVDTFACASATGLKVWEVDFSKEVCTILSPDPTATLEVECKYFCFGGAGHRNSIVSCPDWDSKESCASIWDIQINECVHKLFHNTMKVWDIVCHPTLPIWVTTSGRTVHFWDARTYRNEEIFLLESTSLRDGLFFIDSNKDLHQGS